MQSATNPINRREPAIPANLHPQDAHQATAFKARHTARSRRDQLRWEKADLIRTAYHEAGHAVTAFIYFSCPYRATIVPIDTARGEVRTQVPEIYYRIPFKLAGWLVYTIAGVAAQNRYSRNRAGIFLGGDVDFQGFSGWWAELSRVTNGACGSKNDFERFAEKAVKHSWRPIETVANALLDQKTIEHEVLEDLLIDAVLNEEQPPLPLPPTLWGGSDEMSSLDL